MRRQWICKEAIYMGGNLSEKLLEEVITALKDAGYSPDDQLEGYLQTGDASFITRSGGARDTISKISPECIREYLDKTKR